VNAPPVPHRAAAAGRRAGFAVAPLAGLAAALALANLALYAWGGGGQATASVEGRQPDRLARQLRPEAVRVLAPGEVPPSVPAALPGATDAAASGPRP